MVCSDASVLSWRMGYILPLSLTTYAKALLWQKSIGVECVASSGSLKVLHPSMAVMGLPKWLRQQSPSLIQKTCVQSQGQEDPLEKGMATHSHILAWRIPWIEEPGKLQSTGSHSVKHDWVTNRAVTSWMITSELLNPSMPQLPCLYKIRGLHPFRLLWKETIDWIASITETFISHSSGS